MLDQQLDLRFAPVRNAHPRSLSADQIDAYNHAGFISPLLALSKDEVRALRGCIDTWLEAKGEDGAYGINCYQARLSALWDIARHPVILDYVEDIIGPDILCWASAVLSKPAGETRSVPWHQDAGFWSLNPARTVTVWLAIDDADEGNAAMQFIPGTHDQGAIEMAPVAGEVFAHGIAGADELGTPFVNALRAGECSLHADMLVHGSGPNLSDRRRCGLTLRYCPPSVRIVDEGWRQGVEAVLCRGEAGDWTTHPRPDNNDITGLDSPRAVGNN